MLSCGRCYLWCFPHPQLPMPPHVTCIVVFALSFVAVVPAQSFDCAEKKCGQMQSCAEAYYHFSICGEGERDADNDGIPCENVCGKTMEEYRRLRGATLPGADAPLEQFVPLSATDDSSAAAGLAGAFQCAGKRRCGEMGSCAEARFYLTTCGVRSLDRDKDGVPCESLCGGR